MQWLVGSMLQDVLLWFCCGHGFNTDKVGIILVNHRHVLAAADGWYYKNQSVGSV